MHRNGFLRTPIAHIRGLLAVTVLGVAVAACGSSSAGGVSGGSHDNPEGAVRGFVNALTSWDGSASGLNSVTDWVAPKNRQQFTSGFALLGASGSSIHLSFKVANFDVSSVDNKGDHATVHVKGAANVCFSGTVSGVALNTCSSNALTPSGTKDTVDTVQEGGKWYVDIGSGSSGGSTSTDSGGASSQPSSAASSAPSSIDTGAASSASTPSDTGAATSTDTASSMSS